MSAHPILAALVIAVLVASSGCDRSGKPADDGSPAVDDAAAPAGQATIADALARQAGGSSFLSATRAAGLDRTLGGPGPYTVLAPTDAAFAKLPAGSLDALLKPGARPQLTGVLTYHILPGTILAEDIGRAIDNGKGKAVLATMGGGTLEAVRDGESILLSDSAGTRARITEADDRRSNGVIHRIDAVLMPS